MNPIPGTARWAGSRLRQRGGPGGAQSYGWEPTEQSSRPARRAGKASGTRAGRRRAAPGQSPQGAERAHRDWWQDGPARGVRGARTGPAWAGSAVGGQTPSFLCALGVSAAVEGAGGGLCKGKSQPASLRED